MPRNLLTDKCPRCSTQVVEGDLYGKRLVKAVDSEISVLGCRHRCSCGIDLFIWCRANLPADEFGLDDSVIVHPPPGEIDLSYYHTFDQHCLPGLRFKVIHPRPVGPYFSPKGHDQEIIRGLLAHRAGRWKSYLESRAAWSEDSDQTEPTWEFDEYEYPIYWSATEDEYFRDVSCQDFESCDTCIAAGGRPYSLREVSEDVVFYTGMTERRFRVADLVYFLGQDYSWHWGKVVGNIWSHSKQEWVYEVVDLGKNYSGIHVHKLESDLYAEKPEWTPVVLGEDIDSGHSDTAE